jgi:peptidyl-prolyl cis-trans isomerase A (cyclophilin A)
VRAIRQSVFPIVRIFTAWCILAFPFAALGGSIVEVRTSQGVFFIELNEHAAPISSENFLQYVTTGRYDDTFVYGTADGSFIRGGGYTFANCPGGVQRIVEEPPIAFEQTGLLNKRGTISMVPSSRSLNTATSDWIINLDDNFTFDDGHAGYTPFGEIIGDGLEVVQAIAVANQAEHSDPLDSQGADFFGYHVNCQLPEQSNHISITMTLVSSDTDLPSGRYFSADNELQINLLLPGDTYIHMPFDVAMLDNGEITITAKADASTVLDKPLPNMASYDASNGTLTLQTLEIDGVILYEDVRFLETESGGSTLRLTAFEEL